MDFLGIGLGEILLVLVIALIFLGPEQLPQIAASVGRLLSEIRRASQEVTEEFTRELQAPRPAKSPKERGTPEDSSGEETEKGASADR